MDNKQLLIGAGILGATLYLSSANSSEILGGGGGGTATETATGYVKPAVNGGSGVIGETTSPNFSFNFEGSGLTPTEGVTKKDNSVSDAVQTPTAFSGGTSGSAVINAQGTLATFQPSGQGVILGKKGTSLEGVPVGSTNTDVFNATGSALIPPAMSKPAMSTPSQPIISKKESVTPPQTISQKWAALPSPAQQIGKFFGRFF